eukprot:1148336-Pelagomonas_calceolata.AAC.4
MAGFQCRSLLSRTIITAATVTKTNDYTWLERDLSSVDRCKTPWLALVLHRPMYVVYPHEENRQIGEELRAMLEPLLLHHRVDLTIAAMADDCQKTLASCPSPFALMPRGMQVCPRASFWAVR